MNLSEKNCILYLFLIWLYYLYAFVELIGKELNFVFDEFMGKKYIGKKIIPWNTSEKTEYPNQTDEFGSDSFLKNSKNQTKSNQLRIYWFGHWIHSKPIQSGPITPLNALMFTVRFGSILK
jgi:hypothetical protein